MNYRGGFSVVLIVSLISTFMPLDVFPQAALGEVIISGNVTVNRIKAASGNTIFSESEIETFPNATAVVNLRRGAGVLSIEPSTRLRLIIEEGHLTARLSRGALTLRSKTPTKLLTPQLSVNADADSAYLVTVTSGGTEVEAITRPVRIALNHRSTVVPAGARYSSAQGTVVRPCGSPCQRVLISEVDAHQGDYDAMEFIELYDGGFGNTSLNGMVLVLYDGQTDTVYAAYDLDGRTTNSNGFFIVGNAAVSGVDLVIPDNTIHDGPAAVALYQGSASQFPPGTPLTTKNLIDAMVYSMNDQADAGLLKLINPNQPWVNENANGRMLAESSQRCNCAPCRERDTDRYIQARPTPNCLNNCPPAAKRVTALRLPLWALLIPLLAGGAGLPVALAASGGDTTEPVSPTSPRR
ncbi:MAG: hypothetical protein RMM98_07340 [Acidobacteriota bacterium]|nr:hypothetical protein [Blastocatellia bacterium]MDW8239412.1 hypothetical protein [Acidobacteriota bacterium]